MRGTRLLLITGLPGSGKTTLAQHPRERYGVVFLSKDLIKEPLLDVIGRSGRRAHSTLAERRKLCRSVCRRAADRSRQIWTSSWKATFGPASTRGPHGGHRHRAWHRFCAALPSRCGLRARLRSAQNRRGTRGTATPIRLSSRKDPADEFLALPGERLTFDSGETAIAGQIDAIDRWWRQSLVTARDCRVAAAEQRWAANSICARSPG